MTDRLMLVERMRRFGNTIFGEMSALAVATDSINLGQGFPDTDGPAEVIEAAVAAMRAGHNQYPPATGIEPLRRAIANHQRRFYGLTYDADSEVLVTAGATEAIAATVLALCETGDEVIAFEPMYDSYSACIAMAGAVVRPVTLRPPIDAGGVGEHARFTFDLDELRAAITPRTKLILLNTPHNPTGKVFTVDELRAIADLAIEHDLIVMTDEVYEHLTFGVEHVPLATLAGMRERTIVVSSSGKAFSFTGWKIGWVCAPPGLVQAVRTVKQFLTYVNGAPFQHAVATALAMDDAYYVGFARGLQNKRDLLLDGLRSAGFTAYVPDGTYFITTDIAPFGESDGMAFCRALPERVGVVAIPNVVFYENPARGGSSVRFAFCKRDEVLIEAAARLRKLRQLVVK
ncbi:MAG TPA: pyridoxal phosphate-dependent aminotransferase [Acidimicrobiales bacterium]|nr:pyridoxal phosphate-dependent aminotransferase [Acidimicrobiales bacterium]